MYRSMNTIDLLLKRYKDDRNFKERNRRFDKWVKL